MERIEYNPVQSASNIQILNGRQDTILVTGWLSPNKISECILKWGRHLAATGSLYSANPGFSYLIRNLLANPQIKNIIACQCTRADKVNYAAQTLESFVNFGVEKSSDATNEDWKIMYFDASIHGSIPLRDLEALRSRLRVFPVYNLINLEDVIAEITQFPIYSPPPGSVSKIYPLPEIVKDTSGTCKTGHSIQAQTIEEGHYLVCKYVGNHGVVSNTRFGTKVKESLHLTTTIAPCLLTPIEGKETLENYVSSFLSPSTDDAQISYTYPGRMYSHFGQDQVDGVIANLKANLDSRTAVIDLWDSQEDLWSREAPCLNHIWFRVVQKHLHVSVVFRSHDLYGAWYSNVVAVQYLQFKIAQALNVLPGTIAVVSESAHIYEDAWSKIDTMVKPEESERVFDSVGNFLIEVKDKKIAVSLFSTEGKLLAKFSHYRADVMGATILQAFPHLSSEHIFYLGTELMRAQLDPNYTQDRL